MLEISDSRLTKKKYMYSTRNRIGHNILMDDFNFKRNKKFRYLGTMLSDDTDGIEGVTVEYKPIKNASMQLTISS